MNTKHAITTSAPGKLLLMGEHAVVYGSPCLVTSVDSRQHVSVRRIEEDGVHIESPEGVDTRFVLAALKEAKKRWDLEDSGLHITTTNGFSSTYGFGSSSAVTVATLSALADMAGADPTDDELLASAISVVRDVQAVGSGFDVASAIWGGVLYFKNGKTFVHERLQTRQLPIVVGYTGVKADTKTLVLEVAKKRKLYPTKVRRIFEAIETLVDEGRMRAEEQDWKRLGTLFDFNQEYLRDLGVSSEKLESLISAAKSAGALGAKLSGAGGGDCMIAIVTDETRASVAQAIADAGGVVMNVSLAGPGVHTVTTDDQEELFIVVDENDTVLGHRTRAECHNDPSLIHRAVNVAIFDDAGRVLLQKRSATKDVDPGYWTLSATGHVDRGESYEDAVRREAREELGIDMTPVLKDTFIARFRQETEMEALFTATHPGPFMPNPQEVEEVRFFTKEQLVDAVQKGSVTLTDVAKNALSRLGFLV